MNPMYISLLILLAAVILYVFGKFSYLAISMSIPILLYLTGVLEINEIFVAFTNESVILAGCMFVISGSILSTGVAEDIGNYIIKYIKSEKSAVVIIMLATILMSSFLSNIGTAMIMLPITLGVCRSAKYSPSRLLMPMAFACSLGGMNTTIGAPHNLLANSILEMNEMQSLGFFELSKMGILFSIAGVLYFYFWGYKMLPVNGTIKETVTSNEKKSISPKTKYRNKIFATVIFVFCILGFIFENRIKMPVHITAFIGMLLLLFFRVINEKEMVNMVDWSGLSILAGMFPLVLALNKTGGVKLIADNLIKLGGETASPVIFTALIFIAAAGITQIMSNTASAALLYPIAIAVAGGLNCNPKVIVIAVTVAASCAFITPIGTGSNTIVMASGGYQFKDYMKIGLPLLLICFLVYIFFAPLIWPIYF